MQNLVFMNRDETFAEIVNDFDFSSFQYEYERNNERSISLTAFKTNMNKDIFDRLLNESYLIWKGQKYIIKQTELKYENSIITNDIVAKHISMEFQNHYIDKDRNEETLNDDSEEEKKRIRLIDYLNYGFKNNKLDFDFEIHGDFNDTVEIDTLGDKNGLEYIIDGAELFSYIYFADNKTFHIYKPDQFYKRSDEILVYKYNSSSVSAKTTTTELKTIIKGYGKKKTKKETKNYNPIKSPSLHYSGNFIKKGTWRTENVGDSYSYEFNCKWGNENLEWSFKKGPEGGKVEIFVDGKSKGTYNSHLSHVRTDKIIVATNLKKGKHHFKAVFKGKQEGISYKKAKPTMYVGTSKQIILNHTAILKGTDLYHVSATYKSPLYEVYGHAEAPTLYDDNIETKTALNKKLKKELKDTPTVEVSTNYLGLEVLHENNTIRFIHKPLGFNTDLSVVKLTEHHPLVNQPIEVEFSNAKKDIIQLQQQFNRHIKSMNQFISQTNTKRSEDENEANSYDTEIVGSVLIDE